MDQVIVDLVGVKTVPATTMLLDGLVTNKEDSLPEAIVTVTRCCDGSAVG